MGGCAALEFKVFHSRKDIPLGCFFFRGAEGDGFDVETFLDAESLLSLLEESFQASTVCLQLFRLIFVSNGTC